MTEQDDPSCAALPVRQCLCYPHTFAALHALALARGWREVSEITAAVGCGGGCGLCRPYLARMLQTGETAFAVMPTDG
ncbi:MAG: (2Fe-2S)-binding protein [Armatimonadetes bacterium]|nr:(2Fe-2S)-binding protein [Armatimonadota bacterium]MDE2207847.1 (2Fe-2S)-binding protein [Armatimonadota bacterium]